jgi:hypothetical protein
VQELPKRRSARFLLLPILALIFLFGWLMYTVGGDKRNAKKDSLKPVRSPKTLAVAENDLEMGLTSELAEEEHLTHKSQKSSK